MEFVLFSTTSDIDTDGTQLAKPTGMNP